MSNEQTTKIDLKRELKELYTAKAAPAVVDVPPLICLMIDGRGDPNTSAAYKAAVAALYALSYALKFRIKRSGSGRDYTVMPLEGLWWADDMAEFSMDRRASWQWTMLIVQPAAVTHALFKETRAETAGKKGLPALDHVRRESFHEGPSAQMLHVGPYATEPPTIARLHTFIHARGYVPRGKHHEIYLGDPNHTAPEKLRTIIRQPIARP